MELITPGIGLLFWMLVTFSILLYILGKYAFPPILRALKEREKTIEEALKAADKAREQMAQMKADNERLMEQARREREKMLAETREIKERILSEAREQATEERKKIIESAKAQIASEKAAAMGEIRNLVASLSVDVAEKILRRKLEEDKEQQKLIDDYLRSVKAN
ncbi:MAG: F0F1 ATP synthase subunit B [Bacteroidales bacterium]|jgi:F-type H+-transporting ATPase subunit b|nr:F0F1 ATP synthase subunit B [Bacteroidales bacterium]